MALAGNGRLLKAAIGYTARRNLINSKHKHGCSQRDHQAFQFQFSLFFRLQTGLCRHFTLCEPCHMQCSFPMLSFIQITPISCTLVTVLVASLVPVEDYIDSMSLAGCERLENSLGPLLQYICSNCRCLCLLCLPVLACSATLLHDGLQSL